MCGIMGYIGPKQAVPIIVDGLNKLEYRGYDSAGVAVVNDGKLSVTKTVGRLAKLAEVIAQKPLSGQVGIGHTRWATHGRPSDRNSHPHTDCNKRIAVVHNGIIENYLKLRNELQEKGHIFLSETDTEVIPHLIEEYYHGDLLAAVRQAVIRLEGSFAIVVTAADEPERLVVARKASPLIVGLGQGENYVASDIPAILNYTREVYILDDGELAEVTATGIFVSDFAGNPVRKSVFHVQWDAVAAEKGGYEDFMLKEIHEQPQAIRGYTGRED